MSDLTDRQAAIDALKICDANYDGTNCDKCPLRDKRWNGAWYDDEIDCHTKLMRDSSILLELSSVQPEIIRCKDCKSWGRLVTYKDGSTMIDCKRGRSIDPEGYCHLAELRGGADMREREDERRTE